MSTLERDILDELREVASGDAYLPNSLAEDAAREIAALRASNEIMRQASEQYCDEIDRLRKELCDGGVVCYHPEGKVSHE